MYLRNESRSFDFLTFFRSIYFFLIEVSIPFVIQGFLDLLISSLGGFFNGAFLKGRLRSLFRGLS